MYDHPKPNLTILLLLISFASVNAVLFTPALPTISEFFNISSNSGSYTITAFLLGYALGQLVYGPVANRYGRKIGLYAGITLQILSSFICILAAPTKSYTLLIIGRFLLALGSGVGLKMSFTMINECYSPAEASKKISYLMLAFAITPGLATTLGGFLTMHFGWTSCFVAEAIYGAILLLLVRWLPETLQQRDLKAFALDHLLSRYSQQFTRKALLAGGLLMGFCTSFIYLFAATAPYIAINLFGFTSADYGLANLLPPIGLIIGSLCSANLVNKKSLSTIIRYGLVITIIGVFVLALGIYWQWPPTFAIFVPIIIVNSGLCFILANASTIALSGTADKAHGSAVMNFLNIGTTTVMVIILGQITLSKWLLPAGFLLLWSLMAIAYVVGIRTYKSELN